MPDNMPMTIRNTDTFWLMALLGAMSLIGLMTINYIVLIDDINANLALGESPYESTVEFDMSRVRPVVLGTATMVPVLYATPHRIPSPKAGVAH